MAEVLARRGGSDKNEPPPAMALRTPAKREATGSQRM
jgi:hypothetical protein